MIFRYLLILIFFLQLKAFALIEVDITRGNLNPLPIAVTPLSIDEDSKLNFKELLKEDDIGSEISIVIENNLRKTGLFNPLNKDSFLQKSDIAHLKPRFEDWALIKAQAMITGKVTFVDAFSADGLEYVSWYSLGYRPHKLCSSNDISSDGNIIVVGRNTGENIEIGDNFAEVYAGSGNDTITAGVE